MKNRILGSAIGLLLVAGFFVYTVFGADINHTIKLTFQKGTMQSVSFSPGNVTFNVAGTNYQRGIDQATTNASYVDMGSVTTPGISAWFNMDTNNYFEIGTNAAGVFHAFAMVPTGGWSLIHFTGDTNIQVRANGTNVNYDYLIISQ